jgi:hypothetical protein
MFLLVPLAVAFYGAILAVNLRELRQHSVRRRGQGFLTRRQ